MRAFPSRALPGGRDRRRSIVAAGAGLAGWALLGLPPTVEAQLRRDPAVQPVAEAARGELLAGVGVSYAADAGFPLSGLAGDVAAPAGLTLAYAPAAGVVLEVRGDLHRILSIEERGTSHVPLDEDVDDGTTADRGDFRVGVLARLAGRREGASAGLRLEVRLPNSDEGKGIGTNTTDFRAGILGSWGGGPWRLTGDVGVAILEAPLESFEQNDVLAYSGELLYRSRGGPLRLALSVDGRASTRDVVPVGTGDLGEARAGAELLAGAWRVDGAFSVGYAGSSPAWGLTAGVARVFRL